ncbi:MAG TPA: VCBS repeat-containing protein, partial [Dehalococcoidia bacterium]|nr:VCBS repeat-containing protein [Dehalococcoidia bacterium]
MSLDLLKASRSNHPEVHPFRRNRLPGQLVVTVLASIALVLSADSPPAAEGGSWTAAQGQSTGSALESLGVPMPGLGIPSTNMWAEGNLLYGEAVDPATGDAPFFAYDLSTRQLVHVDTAHQDINDKQRNIMVDSAGNAYFSVNHNGIARYDRESNSVSVLSFTLPNFLRASVRETASGWIYGASGQGAPNDLFRYNPEQDRLEVLGPSWGYTTTMVLDPTERFVYYVPDAHGGASKSGTPVLQYDTVTNDHKVMAFLHPFLEQQTGRVFDGTFGMAIDAKGEKLFISMRTFIGKNTNETRNPGLVVVNLPPQETMQTGIPRISFEDVTASSGLRDLLSDSYVHTSSWGDANDDGWLDLFAGTFGGSSYPESGSPTTKEDPARLLVQNNGVFQDSAQSTMAISGRAAGSAFADFDNDGDLDLYVSNNTKAAGDGYSRILRNDDGVFSDVTPGSGIDPQDRDGRQVGILDFNNDGLLDVLALGGFHVPGPTVLLQNTGNFQFQDATEAAGISRDTHGLGLAIADLTGNGWPDILVTGGPTRNDQRNYLFLANGDGTYRSLEDPVFDWNPFTRNDEDWVGGAAIADLNRDGRLDILIGQHLDSARRSGGSLRVYLNRGLRGRDPVFEDITQATGLPDIFTKAPHVEIQDFDNNGWPDLYTSVRIDSPSGVAPLIFTHNGNSGDPRFSSPPMVNPYYYPGGPVADFNQDGKLDVLLPRVDTRLLQNTGAPGNWLQVNIDTNTGLNRRGIGARIKIYKDGTSELLGFREVSASSGFSSSQASTVHFGLGSEDLVDVVVEMPFGGPVYRENSVPANQTILMPDIKVRTQAHLGLEVTASSATSPQLLKGPGGLPAHSVVSVAPVIDYAVFPLPDHPGVPWSQWGQGLVASNGKFYTAVGDHIKDASGNSYLYEYDPDTRILRSVGDIATAVGSGPGSGGHFGKVHGQINEANDGYIYFTSYWGDMDSAAEDPGYDGSVLLRYPVNVRPVTAGNGSSPPVAIAIPGAEATQAPAPPVGPSASPTAASNPPQLPDPVVSGPDQAPPVSDMAPAPAPAAPNAGSCAFGTGASPALDGGWLLLGSLLPGLMLARWGRFSLR